MQFDELKRREFIMLLGSMVVAWPFAALAQRKSNSYRIGYLALLPGERTTLATVFLQRLHELGYSEDKNMVFEYRSAEGQADRVPALAAELVHADPDVLVAGFGTVAAKAAAAATKRIPIVFTGVGDPVGAESVRGAWQSRHPLYRAGARGSQDSRRGERATIRGLPAIYTLREFADAGGLICYGANEGAMVRRAAEYVDKVLKGSAPADLPVEQPTKFTLVINLKTAKALGLTIPDTLLALADEVIE